MRALLALVLFGGCVGAEGGGAGGSSRPAVMPLLSELPGDATKRDAVLDSAATAASPEQRPGQTPTGRKVETAAATAAAILGGMLSSTKSVTIGTQSQFDENQLIAPDAAPRLRPPSSSFGGAANPDLPPAEDPSNADLIPWIKLK